MVGDGKEGREWESGLVGSLRDVTGFKLAKSPGPLGPLPQGLAGTSTSSHEALSFYGLMDCVLESSYLFGCIILEKMLSDLI